jgi:hypothetical protein
MVDTDTIGTADEIDVGYEFTNMNTWVPTADMRGEVDNSATIERRGTPNINNHLVRSMNVADAYVTGGMAYNSMIFDYYRALTDAYYVVRMLGIDLPANYRSYKDTLNKHKSEFDIYTKEVTNRANTNAELVYKLMGLN